MKVPKLRRHVGRMSKTIIISFMVAAVLTCLISPFLQYQPNVALAQSVNDPNLGVESFVEGLSSPTSMAFLDNENILVLEKEGQVRLVSNGELLPNPVIQIPVDTENERGLLGIAVMNGSGGTSSGPGQIASARLFFCTTLSQEEKGVS